MKYILLITIILGISSYTENEKIVWDFLMSSGLTKAGAAGLMGNLKAESDIRSVVYQDSYKSIIGLTDQEYVDYVNDGRYSEWNFIHDSVGFGLAQWTYYSRKEALLNSCRGKIGDMYCQVDYLVREISESYYGVNQVIRSSNNVRECALKVLFEFESPEDQSESVQNYRAGLAEEYYHIFGKEYSIVEPFGKVYRVKIGDNLYSIAERFGTTVDELAKLNSIDDVNEIIVGEVIKLP